MTGQRKKKCMNDRMRGGWFALLAVLLAITAFWILLRPERMPEAYTPNVTVGDIPDKTAEDIRRELQAAQDEAMISYTVNTNPVFSSGSAMGDWRLDCPEGNYNKLRFVITQDATGDVLYDSGAMTQGTYILEDHLQTKRPLTKGEYAATASVKVLDPETEQEKGQVQVKITVTILS